MSLLCSSELINLFILVTSAFITSTCRKCDDPVLESFSLFFFIRASSRFLSRIYVSQGIFILSSCTFFLARYFGVIISFFCFLYRHMFSRGSLDLFRLQPRHWVNIVRSFSPP